jgi:phenylacetate-CoA ligase
MRAFESLIHGELLPTGRQRALEVKRVADLARFARERVPRCRELFDRIRLTEADLGGTEWMTRLPLLTRADLRSGGRSLLASPYPGEHGPPLGKQTSGSTGQPVRILHTSYSARLMGLLKQREYRWFRFDPEARFGSVRPARDLPRTSSGEPLKDGQGCRLPHWPLVGRYFETGGFVGLPSTSPLAVQQEWLARERPAYLLCQSSDLEHLALALQAGPPPEWVRGIEAISQDMTPAMRARIERVFGVPVQENYGLNEIGLVATRCPEAGRFHVHPEIAFVEILDDDGKRRGPGEPGRLVVTGIANLAMPLFRYDTGDIAAPGEGPCPCGRTTPTFVGLQGRYRRRAFLPPGTWTRWTGLQRVLSDLPQELSRPLRQYQLHQFRDGRFELRLVIADALPDAFVERVQAAWRAIADPPHPALHLRVVETIEKPPGGKFQNFTSELMPARDA